MPLTYYKIQPMIIRNDEQQKLYKKTLLLLNKSQEKNILIYHLENSESIK